MTDKPSQLHGASERDTVKLGADLKGEATSSCRTGEAYATLFCSSVVTLFCCTLDCPEAVAISIRRGLSASGTSRLSSIVSSPCSNVALVTFRCSARLKLCRKGRVAIPRCSTSELCC